MLMHTWINGQPALRSRSVCSENEARQVLRSDIAALDPWPEDGLVASAVLYCHGRPICCLDAWDSGEITRSKL